MIADIFGSLLTHKPQLVLGFLICWLVWGCFKTLLSFGVLTVLWQLPIIISHGFSPYLEYLKFTKTLLYLPYATDSLPISIMATPYALLSTLLPFDFSHMIQVLLIFFALGMAILLTYIATRQENFRSRSATIQSPWFSSSH